MNESTSTRRKFFVTASAAVAAPAVTGAISANAAESDALAIRLAELEDTNALRALTVDWIANVNAASNDVLDSVNRGLRAVVPADFDANGKITFSADRGTASVSLPCVAHFDVPIDAPHSSLIDMARLQGEGFTRSESASTLELHCERTKSGWALARAALSSGA